VSEKKTIEQFLVVTVPVADLRRKPVEARAAYTYDDLQESQLLFNEILVWRREEGDWYYVEAQEQPRSAPGKSWQGYPGWVKKQYVTFINDVPPNNGVVTSRIARLLTEPHEEAQPLLFLSIGTRMTLGEKAGAYYRVAIEGRATAWISVSDASTRERAGGGSHLRRSILNTASLFKGVPYLWGGRSMFMADLTAAVTGVDCSGLTNLVYRANNIDLPRDAHDQWLATTRITLASLKPGDLVFVSKENQPDSINHVMLYTGNERFVEAFETGTRTRENSFQEKFGLDLARIERADFTVQNKRIYFGKVAALDQAG
jgi:gamma-D-glutamyl-L-lysine dipeptidyl-peptidase